MENQSEYKTTVCECETCRAHMSIKQELQPEQAGKVVREPEVNGESVKSYNRDQEGMPCDFCSHHVNAEPSFCVTCDPDDSNYDGYGFEVEVEDTIKKNDHDTDYRPGSTVSKQSERIKELVDAHWSYQEKLLSAGQDKTQTFTWDQVMEMREWDYKSAGVHFYGHGYEDAKVAKT